MHTIDRRALDAWALVRLGFIPVAVGGEILDKSTSSHTTAFLVTIAIAAAYAVLVYALQRGGRQPFPPSALSVLDAALLCALTYETGGPFSQVRKAFFLVPFAAALIGTPRQTVGWALFSVLAYLTIAVPHPEVDGHGGYGGLITHSLYLAWCGVGAVLLANLAAHRKQELQQLADTRRLLVAQALNAEDEANKQVAYALHDGPVQDILAAGRDVDRLLAGDGDAVGRVRLCLSRAADALRQTITALHPYALEHGGLARALDQLAGSARRTGIDVQMHVEPAAEHRSDQLVFSIVRELLTNAEKHANATRVDVMINATSSDVQIHVVDDGQGMRPEQAAEALLQGHVGLASLRERVRAVGGTFNLESTPGVSVHISIPEA